MDLGFRVYRPIEPETSNCLLEFSSHCSTGFERSSVVGVSMFFPLSPISDLYIALII